MATWMRNMMLANPHPQPAEAFIRQLAACGRHDARDGLRSLELPAHVIGAEHDLLVPVWKSRELAELIPGAKLTVIAAAPHGANVERAEEFNKARARLHRGAGARARLSSGAVGRGLRERVVERLVHRGGAVELDDLQHARHRPATEGDDAQLLSPAPSRRARLNSIAMPLESMNSRPVKSTTSTRARGRHCLADRLARRRARRLGRARPITPAITMSPRSSISS